MRMSENRLNKSGVLVADRPFHCQTITGDRVGARLTHQCRRQRQSRCHRRAASAHREVASTHAVASKAIRFDAASCRSKVAPAANAPIAIPRACRNRTVLLVASAQIMNSSDAAHDLQGLTCQLSLVKALGQTDRSAGGGARRRMSQLDVAAIASAPARTTSFRARPAAGVLRPLSTGLRHLKPGQRGTSIGRHRWNRPLSDSVSSAATWLRR